MVLEAMTGYVREQEEAVERAVRERWVEAFIGIPGDVARRAFRSWDRGDRMPNPVELAKKARRIQGEMHHALRHKSGPTVPKHDDAARKPRVTAEAAAAIVKEKFGDDQDDDAARRDPPRQDAPQAEAQRPNGPARAETLASPLVAEALAEMDLAASPAAAALRSTEEREQE